MNDEVTYALRIVDPRGETRGEINVLIFGRDPKLTTARAGDLEWIVRRVVTIDPNLVLLVGISDKSGPAKDRGEWEIALDELTAQLSQGPKPSMTH